MNAIRKQRQAASRDIPLKMEAEIERIGIRRPAQAKRISNRRKDQPDFAQIRQRHERDSPMMKEGMLGQPSRDLQAQPGFAGSAGAGQGHQPLVLSRWWR